MHDATISTGAENAAVQGIFWKWLDMTKLTSTEKKKKKISHRQRGPLRDSFVALWAGEG